MSLDTELAVQGYDRRERTPPDEPRYGRKTADDTMAKPTLTVMHVDDSAAVRQQFQIILQQVGWKVESFEAGETALRRVSGDGHGVDVAILDMMLPGIDGLTITRELRANPFWRDRPILMCSTTASPSVLRAARDAGLDGWAVKPFQPRNLIATIEKLHRRVSPCQTNSMAQAAR